jgi:hypothetical protein
MKWKNLSILVIVFLSVLSCKKECTDYPTEGKSVLDGKYTVDGTLVDAAAPTITSTGPKEYHLRSLSPTEVELFPVELGILGHLILSGTSLSYYGSFGIIVTFDRTTNKITSITNSYGQPASNGRYAILDPSGVNAWDPVTKNIKIKYWMDQPSVIAGHRTAFDETWTYIGPRE